MPQLIISHHRCSSSSAPALLLGGRWGRWARLGNCGVGARHPAPNSPAPTCRLDAHAVDARAGLDVPSPALLAGVLLPTQLTNPCPWLQAAAVSAPLRSSRRATSSRGRSLGAVRGRREHPRVDALARDALRGAHQRPVPDSPARLVASAARRSRQTQMSKLAGVGDAGSGGSAPPAGSPRVMVSLCYRTDILVTIKMLGYGDEQDVGGDAQGRQVDNGGGGRWLLAARHCDGAVRRGVGTTASGDWRVWATHWSAGVGGPAVARVPYYYLIGKNAT
jgi:hypothetical protein